MPSEMLRKGPSYKADLVRYDLPDASIVVKDFTGKPWLWRQVGKFQIKREVAAYRWLGAISGVPRFLGQVDADALALEWVQGGLLKTLPDRVERGAFYVGQLNEIVERIHDRGIAHLDLRSNNNIVVRPDGSVFVLDFASAVRLKPGGLAHRLLFSFLRNLDVSGLLKWKLCLQPSLLTADEQRQLARHDRLSAFWIVNRKRKKGPVPDASGQNDPPDVSASSDGA
jgi:serine/threonine protein kinase